ncbi:unnamed protein product [Trichobilharzia regenti]|nr:unnamed protein product [Trichobilharzia regenti]
MVYFQTKLNRIHLLDLTKLSNSLGELGTEYSPHIINNHSNSNNSNNNNPMNKNSPNDVSLTSGNHNKQIAYPILKYLDAYISQLAVDYVALEASQLKTDPQMNKLDKNCLTSSQEKIAANSRRIMLPEFLNWSREFDATWHSFQADIWRQATDHNLRFAWVPAISFSPAVVIDTKNYQLTASWIDITSWLRVKSQTWPNVCSRYSEHSVYFQHYLSKQVHFIIVGRFLRRCSLTD